MQIAQGTSTVGFSYDNINRRSTLTLRNGVNVTYSYDNDSRVTGIIYKFNANTLGDLSYAYDALGRRTLVNGSFAQTGLPGAVVSATYDAANELTNWNGTTISYDLNGNMLSDGTNTFAWNARNQMATLNSVSLQYDGFGHSGVFVDGTVDEDSFVFHTDDGHYGFSYTKEDGTIAAGNLTPSPDRFARGSLADRTFGSESAEIWGPAAGTADFLARVGIKYFVPRSASHSQLY